MAWAELHEARKKSMEITNAIERLLKEHSSLYKKEIAAHAEKLLRETDETMESIEEEYRQLAEGMKAHRKTLDAKSRFLKRHNSRRLHE